MPYIDTHTHLDFAAFDPDRDQVLSDCARLGVERLVVLGVTRSNWEGVWRLCQQHDNLFAAFGLHPMFMADHQPEHIAALQQNLAERLSAAQCCAVGEYGLDYWDKRADRAAQKQLFEAQLQLAVDCKLPSLLHVRKAHADVIATLKRYRPARGGVIHAFSGSPEEASEYRKLGFKRRRYLAAGTPPAQDRRGPARRANRARDRQSGYGAGLPRPSAQQPNPAAGYCRGAGRAARRAARSVQCTLLAEQLRAVSMALCSRPDLIG